MFEQLRGRALRHSSTGSPYSRSSNGLQMMRSIL
ncbi:MAG: hypothetical protein JOZ19_15155 [Rubrobacter sp.]|nr:hypothetical protein [Rubrobacter sp.]